MSDEKRLQYLESENKSMKEALIHMTAQFERLDEAMASPERIAEDIRQVGGFVSGLNLLYTEDEIVDRAIAIIKENK